MKPLSIALLCALLLGAIGTSGQVAPAKGVWPIDDAPGEMQPSISQADEWIVAMQDALLRQLRDKLAQGGPELALGACHVDAATVARRMARGQGIKAGFTSDRLRNRANGPRPWAAPLVAAHAGSRAGDVHGFAVDLGNAIGVLRPMVQQKMCNDCHGPADQLRPAVRKALEARYPGDRAIGFAPGEIRGWYWVEIPKSTPAVR